MGLCLKPLQKFKFRSNSCGFGVSVVSEVSIGLSLGPVLITGRTNKLQPHLYRSLEKSRIFVFTDCMPRKILSFLVFVVFPQNFYL